MAKIIIDIDDEEYEKFKELKDYGYGTMFNGLVERIANGVVIHKGQFIAICDSDYPITEAVENALKGTAFIGGVYEEEEDIYCFDIKEIIK